jgi:hypothetical protein
VLGSFEAAWGGWQVDSPFLGELEDPSLAVIGRETGHLDEKKGVEVPSLFDALICLALWRESRLRPKGRWA